MIKITTKTYYCSEGYVSCKVMLFYYQIVSNYLNS